MTVALTMIVKNEAATLPRLIASVRDHIDTWTIVDTGSTDDTIAVIEHELAGIPGTLHQRDWVDFGTNRAEALALARGTADYLLLADADFEYEIPEGSLQNLYADLHFVTIHEGEMAYDYAGLLSGALEWKYDGVTHEAIDGKGRSIAPSEVVVQHHCDGGARGDKFERDLALLDGATDPRSVFYRAQTLACLGRAEEAASTYLERAAMGGWDEEVYYSLYRAGVLRDDVALLLQAWSFRPTRLEALYEAMHRLRATGAHEAGFVLAERVESVAQPNDSLFVEPYVYDYAMDFEHALAAHNTGRTEVAAAMYENLMRMGDVPPTYRSAIATNQHALQGTMGA